MKFLSTCLILLIGSGVVLPDTQVSISTPDQNATIGDRVRINVIAKATTDIDAIALDIPKKDFEVISEESLPGRKGTHFSVFEIRLAIAFFSTGDFTVGPFEVKLLRNKQILETRKTNTLEIRIRSVLDKNDRDIKNLKNPIPLRGNPFYLLKYLLGTLFILMLAGFLVIAVRRRKRKKTLRPETTLPPLEELQIRIRELMERKLFESGRFKPFFIRLTDHIKHYLCREYDFNAEDYTSSETLEALRVRDRDPKLHELLESLFTLSDLVKFAKFIPDMDDYRNIMNTLDTLISLQKSKQAPPETEDVSVPV